MSRDDLESSSPLKVLFVCSRNRRRSLTAEHLFEGMAGVEVRSAGTQPAARIPVTEGLLGWADVIVVMEKSHLRRLEENYSEMLARKRIVTLHIPDEFEYMQAELIDELEAKALPLMAREGD